MGDLSSLQSWPKILQSLRTPLAVMGLVVLIIGCVMIGLLPRVSDQCQVYIVIGCFLILLIVVLSMGAYALKKGTSFPEEIISIWSTEDLPITEAEKNCWVGKWNCRWTYRSPDGAMHPYVDDILNIESIDLRSGKLKGTAISSYGTGETYKIIGRISNKRIAHVFYSSPPPRAGLSGMVILKRPPLGDISGWWIGAGRKGGDIGGGVKMTRSRPGDGFEVRYYDVQ